MATLAQAQEVPAGARVSFHDLRQGETVAFSGPGEVRVTLLDKSGRRARLAIVAPKAVRIDHDGVLEPDRDDERDPATG